MVWCALRKVRREGCLKTPSRHSSITHQQGKVVECFISTRFKQLVRFSKIDSRCAYSYSLCVVLRSYGALKDELKASRTDS